MEPLQRWAPCGSIPDRGSSVVVSRRTRRLALGRRLGATVPAGHEANAEGSGSEAYCDRRKRRYAVAGEAWGPGLVLANAIGAAWPRPGPVCLVVGTAARRRRGERLAGIHEFHGVLIEELLFSELEDVLLTTPHWPDSLVVSVAGAT